jgi:hypothetical protein
MRKFTVNFSPGGKFTVKLSPGWGMTACASAIAGNPYSSGNLILEVHDQEAGSSHSKFTLKIHSQVLTRLGYDSMRFSGSRCWCGRKCEKLTVSSLLPPANSSSKAQLLSTDQKQV